MTMSFEGLDLQFPIDLHAVDRRARRYAHRCNQWLQECDRPAGAVISHPVHIVSHLATVMPAEVQRSLGAWLAADDSSAELAADPEQSAANVLAAIERSRDAWLALVKARQIGAVRAAPFVTDLVWLKHEIERAFPNARSLARGPDG